jgi:uncharacterized protein
MKIKLFYHGNCPDGFGSAWAFYQKYKDSIDYEKFFYGKKINASKHDLIYFADCSVSLSKLNELRENCNVIIIDHHKTAIDELKDDPDFYYNINHSGCVLSWKFLFPNKPVPTLLKYIEDRDLWNWNLKNSQEILSYLDSFDFCFDTWSEIDNDLSDQIGTNRIVEIGSSILRYKEKLVKIFSRNTNEIKIRGYNGSIINAPFFQGEIADCFEDKDFVIVYYKLKSHYKCSIRTNQNNVDVSLIAKHFGGGGHQKAAGFLIKDLSELNNI